MMQMPMFQPPTWSVTDLTRYLRDLLEAEEDLQDLWVEGEVSNLSRPASGHLYFTLKDRNAALRCVMWRNAVMQQAYLPANGDAIEVHGNISIYEASGNYQLYGDLIRPAGEGALYQEFLRLKAQLEAEGLFDPQHKQPIPSWPRTIGIVTSPTGAALQDMLDTIRRRFPPLQVVGFRGFPGDAAYASSKAGLAGLTRALSIELASRGITVNLVIPGLVLTEMTGALSEKALESMRSRIPMGRYGEPDEIAEVVEWVARSRYMTGAFVPADGGLMSSFGITG